LPAIVRVSLPLFDGFGACAASLGSTGSGFNGRSTSVGSGDGAPGTDWTNSTTAFWP
jgi:hypothetical protein